ncbi:hypothetical protein M9458_005526, partial [Cirrhinus mrigala]
LMCPSPAAKHIQHPSLTLPLNSGLGTEIAFCFLSPCVVFNILIIAISIVFLCTVNLSCRFTFVAIALISHDTIADLFSLEIPSINVNLDSLLDDSFAAVSSPEGES